MNQNDNKSINEAYKIVSNKNSTINELFGLNNIFKKKSVPQQQTQQQTSSDTTSGTPKSTQTAPPEKAPFRKSGLELAETVLANVKYLNGIADDNMKGWIQKLEETVKMLINALNKEQGQAEK